MAGWFSQDHWQLQQSYWGVITGLDFIWKKGFKRLIIQVDNKFVVEALDGSNLVQRHGSNWVRRIFLQVRNFEALRFEHIFREFKRCADYLVKLDLSDLKDCTWFGDCPLELNQVLVYDCIGSYVRLVA